MSLPKEVECTTQTHQKYKALCQSVPGAVSPKPPAAERSASQTEAEKISLLIWKLKN